MRRYRSAQSLNFDNLFPLKVEQMEKRSDLWTVIWIKFIAGKVLPMVNLHSDIRFDNREYQPRPFWTIELLLWMTNEG